MPKKREHSLGYRIWNQCRLAMHMDSMFQIYDELTTPLPDRSWTRSAGMTVPKITMSLYQSMIVHLDMIKSKQGVSLYGLVNEAEAGGKIDTLSASALRSDIDSVAGILTNIGRQRNNIVAHRSSSLSFREIREAFPVEKADLQRVIGIYYTVAHQLLEHVPFNRPWDLIDTRTGAREILEAVMKKTPTP